MGANIGIHFSHSGKENDIRCSSIDFCQDQITKEISGIGQAGERLEKGLPGCFGLIHDELVQFVD